jgi:uncharacterized protein DUF4105
MESPLLTSVLLFASLAIVLWSAGAIYFDVFDASARGRLAAIAWIGFWAASFLFWHPLWKPLTLLLAAFCGLSWWWLAQRPSQDRPWDPNFTCLARIDVNGDQLTISNVRHSEYSTTGETTPRYETRRCRLSELRGVDALVCTWGSRWMSHPMFVFDFGPDGRVCVSVEVRYRVGQKFSLFRSLYRQQELVYVVSDERDAILRRTKWMKDHDLYLYRLWSDAVGVRQFFLGYANRINALAAAPRWYHGLTTNCTTSVYAQGRGHIRWGWRMLLNGSLDRLLYDRQLLDQRLPFDELKRQSRINEIANRAPRDGFGDYVRSELATYQMGTPTSSTSF